MAGNAAILDPASIAESTSSSPDQPCGVIVVSRAAIRGSSIETSRRCDTVVLLPPRRRTGAIGSAHHA